jgi:hypothetical protein
MEPSVSSSGDQIAPRKATGPTVGRATHVQPPTNRPRNLVERCFSPLNSSETSPPATAKT